MSNIRVSNGIGGEPLREPEPANPTTFHETIASRLRGRVPQYWGEVVPGINTRLNSMTTVVALTFDACGSRNDGYDSRLMSYLIARQIPATLFLNARWIDKFTDEATMLAGNSLFQIENHGFAHRACSVTGRSVYGIRGTAGVAEIVDEVEKGAEKIRSLTGRKPVYYRSGAAHYDEVAVEAIIAMGYQIAGFSVRGDAGTSYSPEQVRDTLLNVRAGDVIIYHMNHPERGTAEGIMQSAELLKRRGFTFVRLSDCGLCS